MLRYNITSKLLLIGSSRETQWDPPVLEERLSAKVETPASPKAQQPKSPQRRKRDVPSNETKKVSSNYIVYGYRSCNL